jgi:hypothetical protein
MWKRGERMSDRRTVLLAVFLTAGAGCLFAGSRDEVQSKWGELSPMLANRKVALTLPAGTEVEGKVVRVEADGLRMRVSKTSDKRTIRKGEQVIPRASVTTVAVTEYRKLGRVVCTLGAMALAGGIVAAQNIDVYEGPAVIIVPAVSAVGIAGSGVAGYFIGKRLDKRVTYIRVAPGD